MNPFRSTSHEPSVPTTLPKSATVNWSEMPTSTCDLEFRPEGTVGRSECLRTGGWMLLAGFFALPMSILLRWVFGESMMSVEAFMVALTLGCILALWHVYQSPSENGISILVWFAAPVWVWAILSLLCCKGTFLSACCFVSIGAFPIGFFVSDQIAHHAIHWITANPLNAFGAREAHRSAWAGRFTLSCEPGLKRRYQQGPWILALAFSAAAAITLAYADNSYADGLKGSVLLLLLSAILLAITLFRVNDFARAWIQTWHFTVHWLTYGAETQYPPYVFQSPSGSPLKRQLLLVLALFVSGCAIASLVDYFMWDIQWQNSEGLEMFVVSAFAAVCKAALYLALNVLVNAAFFNILVYFLIGPVISFYSTSLEQDNVCE